MSNGAQMLDTLRQHRPLLLACEAIGWLHMAGKAHPDFLRSHGGVGISYQFKNWLQDLNPDWNSRLAWLSSSASSLSWPTTLTDFLLKFDGRVSQPNVVGLLQAGHAMASGIEKNLPPATSKYLNQDATHMWLASPFGHPVQNLLVNPPQVLRKGGWEDLLRNISTLLEHLQALGNPNPPHTSNDLDGWWQWREGAIGPHGWLRQAFLSTLAETRLPNNDVTLWDQSYVAAALFKSAVAGAILAGNKFRWDNQLKQQTCWRVLTVGFGTRHYEARAVKIGDWTGAQREIERFFEKVRRLIEVDLAVGSLVYRDDETLAFTFPGDRADGQGAMDQQTADQLREAIGGEIDSLARGTRFETPPVCSLSQPTRSFVPMVRELQKAREALAIPMHRPWNIESSGATPSGTRHVCPVCLVRFNEPPGRIIALECPDGYKGPVCLVRFNEPPGSAKTDNARKSYPCSVCRDRRRGRLDAWLAGGEDTIWISEVADNNDRVALLTLNFDLEPWLAGEHVDSLRAQSIAEWRRFNPVLSNQDNPIDSNKPVESLRAYIESKLGKFDKNDPVLSSLQEGYRYETAWEPFFAKIVEDRADAPSWKNLDDHGRARWLTHQLFRKLPSPGRVYRFWRTAEQFFDELLVQFREIASAHENRWRTRRLLLDPDTAAGAGTWEDRETYLGHWRGTPFEVVYLDDRKAFVTASNLARCFAPEETNEALKQATQAEPLELKGDDGELKRLSVKSVSTPDAIGVYAPVIPLDRSPLRFRVLVPLDRATACIETAIMKWQEEFARVWDRMPLRIGVVAFPRMTPVQAVIEAARNLEDALERDGTQTWRVIECRTREGVTALSLEHALGRELVLVPTRLPDGREDVFYPYVRVDDRELRFPRDFQDPGGRVFRHMADLRPGDGIQVDESRIAAVFLDTTAKRFEPAVVRPLGEFDRMLAIWKLLERIGPSLSALRGAWSELEERSRTWRGADGSWLPGGKAEWIELARVILKDRLGIAGAALATLVEAAAQGTLAWALDWHLTWLKQGLEGVKS